MLRSTSVSQPVFVCFRKLWRGRSFARVSCRVYDAYLSRSSLPHGHSAGMAIGVGTFASHYTKGRGKRLRARYCNGLKRRRAHFIPFLTDHDDRGYGLRIGGGTRSRCVSRGSGVYPCYLSARKPASIVRIPPKTQPSAHTADAKGHATQTRSSIIYAASRHISFRSCGQRPKPT